MRTLVIAFLLIASPPAWAQSPEQAYLAARVQAAAALEEKAKAADAFDATKPGGGTWYTAHDQARSILEAQLRRALGPIPSPKGFSGAGTFSPDTLCCWPGVGLLDGILFRGATGSVLVTTEGLLRHWLREHKDWWKDDPLATDPSASLLSSTFYTQAISADAAVTLFAPLPIHRPAGATLAVAALALQCNGSCTLPLYVAVAVIKGGRVQVALVDAALPTAAPGTCDAVWKDFRDRYRAAYAAYEASKETPKAYGLLQAAGSIETEGGAAVDKCRRSQPQGVAAFPGLTRQAQDLVEALARD